MWIDRAVGLLATEGTPTTFRVRGESMRPTLEPDSEVRVDPRSPRPRFGEMILFRQANYLTVHRYLGPARFPDGTPCLRTRGDGRAVLDPPLRAPDLRGRVVAIRRTDGWRSVEGPAARAYAVAVGLHDLAWAALAAVAHRFERAVGWGREGGGPIVASIGRADRALLSLADRALFRALHRRDGGGPAARPRAGDRP